MLASSLLLASSCLLYGVSAQVSFSHAITVPDSFGAKTDFGDRAIKALVSSFAPQIELNASPQRQDTYTSEPTCANQFGSCSTTYFGEIRNLMSVDSAALAVVWHSDVTPSACQSSKGCDITSAQATADMKSQSSGWDVSLTVGGNIGTSNSAPAVNAGVNVGVTGKYSSSSTTSNTITTTKTYKGTCDNNNECFLETGTVFLDITGDCASDPLIVCSKDINPCSNYNYYSNTCSQWSEFTKNHCSGQGQSTNPTQKCTMRVGLQQDDGSPLAIQVFQQYSLENVKRATSDPFGELPDGSSGGWIAFEQ